MNQVQLHRRCRGSEDKEAGANHSQELGSNGTD